jgi:hypothetical protein
VLEVNNDSKIKYYFCTCQILTKARGWNLYVMELNTEFITFLANRIKRRVKNIGTENYAY